MTSIFDVEPHIGSKCGSEADLRTIITLYYAEHMEYEKAETCMNKYVDALTEMLQPQVRVSSAEEEAMTFRNDWLSEKAARTKADAHVARLQDVLEHKGIGDAWRDGFQACADSILSFRMHVTWGPEATANYGLEVGIDSLKDVVRRQLDSMEERKKARACRPRVYLDLDGVMADFDAHFPATFGLDHRSLADDDMWTTINGHPSYFRDMPPCPGAVEFFREIEHLRPIVLTACPRSNYAHVAKQKREWVREHLSKHVTVLPVMGGRNKPLFMQEPGDILIDDWVKNTAAWEAAGGVAILHTDFATTRASLAPHLLEQGASEKEADYTREDYHRLHGQLVDTQDRLSKAEAERDEAKRHAAEENDRANRLASIIRDCPEARSVWGDRITDEAAGDLAELSTLKRQLEAKGTATDEQIAAGLAAAVKVFDEAPDDMVLEDLRRRIVRAILEASLPLVTEGWKPIDSAPKDGTWFWAYYDSRYEEDRQRACRWRDRRGWEDAADSMNSDPTHWMPLPAAPAPTAKEAGQ